MRRRVGVVIFGLKWRIFRLNSGTYDRFLTLMDDLLSDLVRSVVDTCGSTFYTRLSYL